MQDLLLTTILILSTLLQLSAGLKLGFGDDDKKTTENDGSVRMSVSASEVDGSVTVEVIPMTIDEYTSMTGDTYILESIGVEYDPAEADLDFNSLVHTIVIEGNGEHNFNVDIVDDTISEFEESFILFLRVVNISNPEEIDVEITRNVSIIRIRVDSLDAYQTMISLVLVNSTLNENDGLVPHAAYIEIEGSVESTVTVSLSVTPLDVAQDIRLVQTEIQIAPNETRVPVALELLDDSIAEIPERATLFMMIPQKYSRLFSRRGNIVGYIDINDDDVPVVGFEEDPSHTLFEGQTTEVCVILSEPDTVERILSFEVSYTSNSELSLSGDLNFGFYSKPYKHCFNVSFHDNDVINYPLEAVFSLNNLDQGDSSPDPVFQPGNITLTVKDDDGVPMPLTDIQTHYLNSNKDVLLTWKSEPTDLQPINEYVVVVSSASFVSSVEPRQKKDDLSSVVEYSTPWTYFLIEGLDQQQSITVHVCAENDLGRTCTEPPQNLSFVELTSPKEIKDQEETGLELKYLIPIIVLPILLAVLCFVLLLVAVVICVCAKSRSKHYYPARQEQRMESSRQSFAEGRYKMRETPSTESVEWIGKPSEENGMWNQIKKDLELNLEGFADTN